MRKIVAATNGAVLLLGMGLSVAVAMPAQAETARRAPDSATALAWADRALGEHKAQINAADGEKYTARRTVIDGAGTSHVRYDRTYRGLPVLGGDFVVHTDPAGRFAGADVAQKTVISLPTTTPATSPAAAVAVAKPGFQGTLTDVGNTTLVVDATTTPRLAWLLQLHGRQADGQTPSRENVIVDASKAAAGVLARWETIGTVIAADQRRTATAADTKPAARPSAVAASDLEAVVGVGHGVYNGTVALDTSYLTNDKLYQPRDQNRGRAWVCDAHHRDSCGPIFVRDNEWGDGTPQDPESAVADALYGHAVTYDYYQNVHGRAGILGDGAGALSVVHYGDNYTNAFWDGQKMTYGDGTGNINPLVALDVAGHEMTHGVTEALSGLEYRYDSGGLNEATSDIFGSMVEFSASNAEDPGDYEIGEEINLFGDHKPLRYMYQPSLDGRSFDCYSGGVWPDWDPHYTSGPGNHFFYLLAEGTSGGPKPSPTCDALPVAGIGKDKAAKIWYRALDVYFTSREEYPQARAHTLKAAADLYGLCGMEYQTVQAAWDGVNVKGTDASCGPRPIPLPTTEPPADKHFDNPADLPISEYPGVTPNSGIAVWGQPGNAPSALAVQVDITHPKRLDLYIDLIAPDGTVYPLQKWSNEPTSMFTVDASSEPANGIWRLRIWDSHWDNSGTLNGWSLQF